VGDLDAFDQMSSSGRSLGVLEQLSWKSLFDISPHVSLVTNTEGTILWINARGEQLLGYKESELIGQPIEVLLPVRSRLRHPCQFENFKANPRVREMGVASKLTALHSRGSVEEEGWRVRKDGSRFWANAVLKCPDLEESKSAVLNSLPSQSSARIRAG